MNIYKNICAAAYYCNCMKEDKALEAITEIVETTDDEDLINRCNVICNLIGQGVAYKEDALMLYSCIMAAQASIITLFELGE